MWNNSLLKTIYLGLTHYEDVWQKQKELFNQIIEAKRDANSDRQYDGDEYLLLTEHHPVITLGKHADPSNLLLNEESLRERGVTTHRIERGGDVTFHGPGQLVAYPIIDMRRHHLGVKDYINLLEECVIRLIAQYGVKGERVEGASGVWISKGEISERKIAAVGVKCSHFVTMHGIALNITTDMTGFQLINPCGFVDKGVTSLLLETGETISMDEAASEFDKIFRQLLF